MTGECKMFSMWKHACTYLIYVCTCIIRVSFVMCMCVHVCVIDACVTYINIHDWFVNPRCSPCENTYVHVSCVYACTCIIHISVHICIIHMCVHACVLHECIIYFILIFMIDLWIQDVLHEWPCRPPKNQAMSSSMDGKTIQSKKKYVWLSRPCALGQSFDLGPSGV